MGQRSSLNYYFNTTRPVLEGSNKSGLIEYNFMPNHTVLECFQTNVFTNDPDMFMVIK